MALMHRRLLICAIAGWPATRLLAQDDAGRPHRKVSERELRKALGARFPLRFGVPGLFDVQVNVPRLQLLPARQRLGATVPAVVDEAGSGRAYRCEMDLLFALRWEAADRTLRAHHLDVVGLRSPALRPRDAQAWQALLQDLTRNAVGEIVLHRFSAEDLALPDALGLRPETITVEDDGIEIWFGPRFPPNR
jgi:hypothetical protein